MPTTTREARASAVIQDSDGDSDSDNQELDRLLNNIVTALGKSDSYLRRQWTELRQTFSAQLTRTPRARRHRKPFAAYAVDALPSRQLLRVLDIVYADHWNHNVAAAKKEESYRTRAARDLGLEHHFYLYLWFGEDASDNYLEDPFISRDFTRVKQQGAQEQESLADEAEYQDRSEEGDQERDEEEDQEKDQEKNEAEDQEQDEEENRSPPGNDDRVDNVPPSSDDGDATGRASPKATQSPRPSRSLSFDGTSDPRQSYSPAPETRRGRDSVLQLDRVSLGSLEPDPEDDPQFDAGFDSLQYDGLVREGDDIPSRASSISGIQDFFDSMEESASEKLPDTSGPVQAGGVSDQPGFVEGATDVEIREVLESLQQKATGILDKDTKQKAEEKETYADRALRERAEAETSMENLLEGYTAGLRRIRELHDTSLVRDKAAWNQRTHTLARPEGTLEQDIVPRFSDAARKKRVAEMCLEAERQKKAKVLGLARAADEAMLLLDGAMEEELPAFVDDEDVGGGENNDAS
ncbi:hypothetical protein EsH8_XIV_000005 [Colletotrichum jinshuiense]